MEKYILKNKLLKLVAFNCIGEYYGEIENIDFSGVRISGAIPSNFWYLHGKLVDIVGYDRAIMLNAEKIGMLSGIVGIVSVFIYNVIEPCIGYFWKDAGYPNVQMGYVCLLSDKESREWALELFLDNMKKLENLKAN